MVFAENSDNKSDKLFFQTVKIHRHSCKILMIDIFQQKNGQQKAFQSGADAYLEYPCAVEEVMEAIEKLQPPKRQYFLEEPLKMLDLELYPGAYEAFRAGKRITLRKKEYQLLEFLLRNKNRVINRNTILEYIWSYDTSAVTNTLDVHMSALRRKIDGGHDFKMIQTVYGAGYKLCDH